jgi:replicative DNA helicase
MGLTQPLDQREAPQTPEAEVRVIAGLIFAGGQGDEPMLLAARETGLRAVHFYAPLNQLVFNAIVKLHGAQQPWDYAGIMGYLVKRKQFPSGGLGELLATSHQIVLTYATIQYYAQEVREAANKRSLIMLGRKLQDAGFDRGTTVADDVATFSGYLDSVRDSATITDVEPIDQALDEAMDAPDLATESGGVVTGLRLLDDFMNPVYPKETLIVGARPGIGKSALSEHIAMTAAIRGQRVLFIPQEMGRRATLERMVAREHSMTFQHFRTLDRNAKRAFWMSSQLRGKPLLISDNGMRRDTDMILSDVSRFKPDVLIIDHLIHIKGWSDKRGRERSDEAARRVLDALIDIKNRFNIPLIAMHQLNREVDGKPTSINFRGTGAVEELADKLVAMHREDDAVTTTFAVLKNRSGPEGNVSLHFNGPLMTFEEPRPTQFPKPMASPRLKPDEQQEEMPSFT